MPNPCSCVSCALPRWPSTDARPPAHSDPSFAALCAEAAGARRAQAGYTTIRLTLFKASAHWLHVAAILVSGVSMLIAYKVLAVTAQTHPDPVSTAAGVCEYARDIVYLGVMVVVLACLTDWAWLILTIVPVYAGYLLWTYVLYPYIFTPREGERPETAAEKKKREKLERKEKRLSAHRR
mmetsp:Transcript_15810/g.49703  ORF Transcript_15810/g.49703 Transcript_15810/m.49703 type:complete len:180 (-) Transcript_15810:95-634(-)